MDECFKIDMGCECYPLPPDKPLPFLFPLFNSDVIGYPVMFYTHPSNPGKVGVTSTISLPNYTSDTFSTTNFAQVVNITIDPPPGFPGPGLTQATATMTVNTTTGAATVTMTNNGAGYTTGSGLTAIGHTLSNFNTINVKRFASSSDLGQPTALLASPLPTYPNLTLSSAVIIPQLCGYITNNLSGGSPITVSGKWYKNGIQIGSTIQRRISTEGNHKLVHYCAPTTFTSSDILSYKITCPDAELVQFTGDIVYYVQYI